MDGLKRIIRQFQAVGEYFPCMLIADCDGRYAYVNEGWCNYLHHRPEEVIGRPVREIAADTRVDEVLNSGRAVTGYTITTKEGESLYNNCVPLFDQGVLVGAMVITFFTRTEDAILFSRQISEMSAQLSFYKDEMSRLRGARYSLDAIIGKSSAIRRLKEQIENAAQTTSTVLIEGETGCGKELVANAIHSLSVRREQPFIKVNCAAIPKDLIESELFGYEGGAFTGARQQGKKGLFEAADEGSLFLDEIHQLQYHMQPKLLRVLQEREVQRVGSTKTIPVNVRIIAATNQSLEAYVEQNRFREDLFYRLNIVSITIPPLRERREDIPMLVEVTRERLNHELGLHVDGITGRAEEMLASYDWPGNVRELQNVVERAMNRQMSGILDEAVFSDYFVGKKNRAISIPAQRSLGEVRRGSEKELILNTLQEQHYNKTKTAQALKISRTQLYQKLRLYQIES